MNKLNELLINGFIATAAQLRGFGFSVEGDGRHYVFQRRDVVFIGCGHYNEITAPDGFRAVGTVITPPSTAVDITAEAAVTTAPTPPASPRDTLRPLVEALVEGLLASMMPAAAPAPTPVVELAAEEVVEPAAEPAEEPAAELVIEPAAEPAEEPAATMSDGEATSVAVMITCMEALAASAGKDNARRQRALAAVRKAFMETTGHDDALIGAAEALMKGSTKRWRAQRASAVDISTDLVEVA